MEESKKIIRSFSNQFIVDKQYSFQKVFSNNFNQYLKKKINFINKNYLILKKQKFKTGLYRFGWYLNP